LTSVLAKLDFGFGFGLGFASAFAFGFGFSFGFGFGFIDLAGLEKLLDWWFRAFDNFALSRATMVLGVSGSLSSFVSMHFLKSPDRYVKYREVCLLFVDLRGHVLRTWG